jgi:hypothetical protein
MFKIVETARSTGHSPKRVKFLENFKTFLYKTWKESRNAIFKPKIRIIDSIYKCWHNKPDTFGKTAAG